MINILLVTTELRPGGAEKCLSYLACHLDKATFRPVVVSLRSAPPESERKLIQQLKTCEIPVHFLDCNSKFASFRAVNQLKNLIRDQKIDLVQSFLFHANVMAGIAVKQFPSVKLFTNIRVADPKKTRHVVERWLTNSASKIVCVSRSVRDFADKTMKLPASKLVSIPNGLEMPKVDPDFAPEDLGIEGPYFVFVGRLEQQKGLVPFLAALQKQGSGLPDFDIVFVGHGSLRAELESLSSQVKPKCHFVGWQTAPQNLMKHSVGLILPSIWEGMPNVVLEAMSLGVPIVAFDVDGVSEIIRDKKNQLVQPGDYQMFFRNMTQLLTDNKLAKTIGAKNEKWIEEEFSLKKMIANYESIYLANPDHLD